jgi:hypothetical protein
MNKLNEHVKASIVHDTCSALGQWARCLDQKGSIARISPLTGPTRVACNFEGLDLAPKHSGFVMNQLGMWGRRGARGAGRREQLRGEARVAGRRLAVPLPAGPRPPSTCAHRHCFPAGMRQ